jgi:ubiquinone/menaquinone biosynthesis C-methylase UbiE
MGMHVFAGQNGPAGKADHLTVAIHRLAGMDLLQSYFVAAGDKAAHRRLGAGRVAGFQDSAWLQADFGDGDIVLGMQVYRHLTQRQAAGGGGNYKIKIYAIHSFSSSIILLSHLVRKADMSILPSLQNMAKSREIDSQYTTTMRGKRMSGGLTGTWAEREARRIGKARTMLQPGLEGAGGTWADLGCGDGIFTAALYGLLQPGSQIYAVDNNRRALEALSRNFAESYPQAALQPVLADFTRPLTLPPLDGLLMANSLHFVREKKPVLAGLVKLLKPGGRLMVVEYNTRRGNAAVPYPLDEWGFLALAEEAGLRQAGIVARIPSTFLGEMYAGMALVTAVSES